MFIQGIDVLLHTTEQTGEDEFGAPIYEETVVTVPNVLPVQPDSKEEADELNLSGKRLAYVLCIPKGDTHDWEDKEVEFFGQKFHTIGHVFEYIEKLVYGDWNKRIRVERYE